MIIVSSLMTYSTFAEPPTGYKCVFDENFSTFNRNVWNGYLDVFGQKSLTHHNDSYLNDISAEDVLLGDETVLLRNRKTETGYSSGTITTKHNVYFTYGYIEVRAKFPGGAGVWPAIWLMPESNKWPPEFDIAEYYATKKLMHLGLCWGNFPTVNWDSGGNTDEDFEGRWNTYGLLWEPNKVQWIQNGKIKREITGDHIPKEPMYIILSNGVSSKIGPCGKPNCKTKFPNYLEIDYVRIWQKNE